MAQVEPCGPVVGVSVMRSLLAGMDMWKRRFFMLLALTGSLVAAAVLLLVVFGVGDPGSEAPLIAEGTDERRTDDRSRASSYAKFEGQVLSIDRPSNTLRLRVVEAEYGQGVDHPVEVVVELPPTFEIGDRLRLGSYIELDGVYVPGENVLYVSVIEFEDEDDDRRTSDGPTTENSEPDEHETWEQQQAEQVYEDHQEQEEREQQQAEQVYEDYDEPEEQEQQQAEQVYEDYDEPEEQEQRQAEQVYEDRDEEEIREDEDDSEQYEAYDGNSDDREHDRVSSYAEFEGRVVAVDVEDRSFRLRVLEAEHARGVQVPAEVTVELPGSWTVPGWIRVGRYVEVEGRFVAGENVLYASEIELEDD